MITARRSVAFTLVELLVVIGIITLLISLLLPSLKRARETATRVRMEAQQREQAAAEQATKVPAAAATAPSSAAPAPPARPQAIVRSFSGDVTLTPRLSVGSVDRESIYETKFAAELLASPGGAGENEIQLPLPPQIISLADLSVTVAGKPSDAVAIRGDKLVWTGPLAATAGGASDAVPVAVTYNATGRGIYVLSTPPGKILDQFKLNLTATGSDVRMLELSMQPTHTEHHDGATGYTWDYKRLMFGRPVVVDVLGIAPVDRLGELSWLGPMSVVVFGLTLGLIARAYAAVAVDKWMLLMLIGTFTGAYPLMYFAQEFIPYQRAMVLSAAVVLLVITVRSATILGLRLGLGGVAMPAAAIMALTLLAAVRPNLQGILLTTIALGLFIMAMTLTPRLGLMPPAPRREPPEPALA